MDVLSAAILGMVQGLTEFLPVSSSGHLILARAFFGWDPGRFGIAFDVACHVGTLLAVVAFFRADVAKLIAAAPGALAGRDGDWERQGRLIIAGTIPIVIVGGLFADVMEAQLRSPLVVAITLTLGGIGLLVAERLGRKTREARTLGYGEAVLIGIAQAAALAPGVSRSGATLTMGMLLHLERASAARFVFLMSLPAIVAAAVKEGLDVAEVGLGGLPVTLMAVGLVTSAMVGYITVAFFVRYLARHSLTVFAYYRFVLAAITVFWLAART
ncbi:MAG TPA: undecaprenyl-diphosphate phosphatase [Vicinamibacterales bacterium]|nr:undecaprenyl-diphosphate phosphatase [Vicinamibacterales bacterium]